MIKALIFDFAGVITTKDAYWDWIENNVKGLDKKRPIFQRLSEDVDRSTITHEDFLSGFARTAGIAVDTVWPEIKKRSLVNHSLLWSINELRDKYKIALFSNFTFPWINELLDENNLRQYFDAIFISSEEKMIKPDPRAFQRIIDLLGILPEEAVFFDDKQRNVDGANDFGIRAFLFTTCEQFDNDLSGVLGK